ncbi:carbohydrate ABC transporter permease [Lachnoclostridium phytofermentans]|uniref:Binding-protein-dependent transport systems inner membrane component n=1 Tax=Lachnoclostridium phytofermentans (strain ATCC 700394 / DSM 18823 / ISDg) TaxID=357809 RepID=A9KLB8_LACP7|nr:carbohydrate ABC transporter permease [Lachnoclostridium phytofermentans]ABX41247.1 binding-protein-dependent transport systems inner membrane component [Lachnoclostridium phytofermentans ISDg]
MKRSVSSKIKRSKGTLIFDILNTILMLFICFVCIYPIWYVIVNSFNDANDALMGGIYWWPRQFSLQNYKTVFSDNSVLQAFKITIAKTLIGTTVNVLFTAMVAYPLSKKYLIGRKFYMAIGTITMFFSGGLIPTFLLFKGLGLLNNFWVYVIPAAFNFFNLLIMINFFREIPDALEESAKIDGANDFTIFRKVILPLSKPVLATIALFAGVGQWNDYFGGLMYITDNRSLEPIQTYLYRLVAQVQSSQMASSISASNISAKDSTSTAIKLAAMVITTLPICCVYPFLQKYFIKGMMIGAVKE